MANSEGFYSFKGQEPNFLPHRIILSNGLSRTDVSTFSDEEIFDAGFTGPFEKPEFNPEIETLNWDEESKTWIKNPISDEIFWENLRGERDMLLRVSDRTQLLDFPLTTSKREEWKIYRQQLRDLPKNIKDPKNVIWPAQPE